MAPWHHLLFFVLIQINSRTEAQWNISLRVTPPLPGGLTSQAVGYDNGKIYLFGGSNAPQSWVEYVITTNTFIDKGSDALPYISNGNSQHYHQIDDQLYWLKDKTIYSYDFLWQSFTVEKYSSYLHGDYGCLTSYEELLFVIGGFYLSNQRLVEVLNISSLSWITPVDDMINARRDFACTTDTKRGVVYAIGGFVGAKWSSQIEKLSVKDTNLSETVWQSSASLGYTDWGLIAVYVDYADSILIIGADLIQRIDCETGQVGSLTDLRYWTQRAGVIFVDSVLYVFGGSDNTTWQHITNPLILGVPNKDVTTSPETKTTVHLEANTDVPTNSEAILDTTEESSNGMMMYIIGVVGAILFLSVICASVMYLCSAKRSNDDVHAVVAAVSEDDNAEEDECDIAKPATEPGNVRVCVTSEASEHESDVAQNEDIENDAKEKDSDSSDHDSMYEDQLQPDNQRQMTVDATVGNGETGGDEGEGEVLGGTNFKQWDSDHILNWILSIENGILMEYEADLRKEIFSRNVNGDDIVSFDIDDIKALGVTKFAHAKLLQNAIVELIKQGHNDNVNVNASDTCISIV